MNSFNGMLVRTCTIEAESSLHVHLYAVTSPIFKDSHVFTRNSELSFSRVPKSKLYKIRLKYRSQNIYSYLLLTEFEVRTVSYGPSFSLRFMAQARSARAINRRGNNEDL